MDKPSQKSEDNGKPDLLFGIRKKHYVIFGLFCITLCVLIPFSLWLLSPLFPGSGERFWGNMISGVSLVVGLVGTGSGLVSIWMANQARDDNNKMGTQIEDFHLKQKELFIEQKQLKDSLIDMINTAKTSFEDNTKIITGMLSKNETDMKIFFQKFELSQRDWSQSATSDEEPP